MTTPLPSRRWAALFLLLPTSTLLAGVGFGMISSAINDLICHRYLEIVLYKNPMSSKDAILQGVFEGFISGAIFTVILLIVIAAGTGMRCRTGDWIKALVVAIAIVTWCWLIGGVCGLFLTQFCPSAWGWLFIDVPSSVSLDRFAWVGGSIAGTYIGAGVAVIWTSVQLVRNWNRFVRESLDFAFPVELISQP